MLIRDAADTDLEKLIEIQKNAFMIYTQMLSPEQIHPLHESLDELKRDFQTKSILTAEYQQKIAGSVRYFIKAGVCFLEKLSVDPEYQGCGIGHALVNEVEKKVSNEVHKLSLETGFLATNLIAFYTKLGYSGEAILKNHFGRFDWVVFSKFIK